jgi:hypothetical protein
MNESAGFAVDFAASAGKATLLRVKEMDSCFRSSFSVGVDDGRRNPDRGQELIHRIFITPGFALLQA